MKARPRACTQQTIMDTFKKRQKEMARQERQREKEARRRAKIKIPLSEQVDAPLEAEPDPAAESSGAEGTQPIASDEQVL